MTKRTTGRVDAVATACVLLLVWGFLLLYFDPSLLLLDTMDAGGDTPSFLRPIHHLRDVLLPAGHPQGFDLGNFAGYAPYQFYFLPPSLAIVALSALVPLNVAFKLITVLGTFLMPLTTMLALRAMGYRFPVPAIGGAAILIFLFNEGNSMWGGNVLSTLAGEFAFSIGFALAILFLGLLYRGIERQRGWRALGVLLALTGLCHPVAFLNAATPGLFFLLGRRHFARNLRFIFAAYGTAVLLMAFWLFPLMAKLGYATSINWKWFFDSWTDLLPTILQPVAALAVLDVLWIPLRRRDEDRPARYLLFAAVITIVSFLNATAFGLPEIRFVPFVYVLLLLLAIDFLQRVLPLEVESWPDSFPLRFAPHVATLGLSLCFAAWAQTSSTTASSWIRWNYEGLEKKPSYPLLQELSKVLEGSIGDPRVAYENSPKHDRFGSMRVFENMALFSGRATLEGVLLQTATTSPFIYWLQSQISKQGTGVIPGYTYPLFDPVRATPRLALFNAHDMIAVTDEAKSAFDGDPRWQRTFAKDSYAVFHLKDTDPHYVRVPRFHPVLLESEEWKRSFHRWFAGEKTLDVPLVAAHSVPESERQRFALSTDSPTDPPRQPIAERCEIDERIDHLAIEFTTSCPGLPHWIAISHFPNWQVEGASRIFLASPAFMLVFPDGTKVRIRFRRVAADWIGILLSLGGLGLCVARPRRAVAAEEPSGLPTRVLEAIHPILLVTGVAIVVLITAWNVVRDVGPEYFYERGFDYFDAEDYASARRNFEIAMRLGGRSHQAADATFFRAASLLQGGDPEAAMHGYEQVITEFPDSRWVAESHYHVGLCLRQLDRLREAAARFRYVITTYPGNRWAGFSAGQLEQLPEEFRSPEPGGTTDG
jgi:hypothetical protein